METINLYKIFLDELSEEWFQFIKDNPDKPWNYYELSYNPNITWEIVQENPNKPWNYYNLSKNEINKPREEFIRKKFQEWFRRSDLKEELIANVWHPRNFEKFKYLDPETFGDEEEF